MKRIVFYLLVINRRTYLWFFSLWTWLDLPIMNIIIRLLSERVADEGFTRGIFWDLFLNWLIAVFVFRSSWVFAVSPLTKWLTIVLIQLSSTSNLLVRRIMDESIWVLMINRLKIFRACEAFHRILNNLWSLDSELALDFFNGLWSFCWVSLIHSES